MRTRFSMCGAIVLLVVFALLPGSGRVSAAPFGVSVSVSLCEVNPENGSEQANASDNCEVEVEGAVVTLTVQGEGELGTCETESSVSPNGGVVNSCSIDGAELNSTLVFTLDESTLPEGYVVGENPITVEVGDLIPGGGDQSTVRFVGWLEEVPEEEESPSEDLPGESQAPTAFNADIITGDCASPGEGVAILTSVEIETGPAVGQPEAIHPEISQSTVDISLDDLIDIPHSISVYGVGEFAGDRILCGEIGGVDNDDGTIHIGLHDVGGAGASGLATLSYSAGNPEQTDIFVYVIPVN